MAMYINKDQGKFSVNMVGKGPQPNLLHHLLRQFPPQKNKVNLYPLIKDNAVNNTYAPIINEIERTHRPREIDLLIRYRPNQASVERSFVCYFGDQFLEKAMLQSFVEASSKKDIFLAFRLFLSKTGRPDMNFVGNEIKYIHHYATHKAKELESELWSVAGVVDIVDISEELMVQLGLSPELIERQASRKRQLLEQW